MPASSRCALRAHREGIRDRAEFGLVLLYAGMRLSDPLRARLRDLKLDQALLYTRYGERRARPVHLPSVVVKAFRSTSPHGASQQGCRHAIDERLGRPAAARRRREVFRSTRG